MFGLRCDRSAPLCFAVHTATDDGVSLSRSIRFAIGPALVNVRWKHLRMRIPEIRLDLFPSPIHSVYASKTSSTTKANMICTFVRKSAFDVEVRQ